MNVVSASRADASRSAKQLAHELLTSLRRRRALLAALVVLLLLVLVDLVAGARGGHGADASQDLVPLHPVLCKHGHGSMTQARHATQSAILLSRAPGAPSIVAAPQDWALPTSPTAGRLSPAQPACGSLCNMLAELMSTLAPNCASRQPIWGGVEGNEHTVGRWRRRRQALLLSLALNALVVLVPLRSF